MTRWLSARDLAGLPGLPGTERGINKRAGTESWHNRPRRALGGGREYSLASILSSLPAELRVDLLAALATGAEAGKRLLPSAVPPAAEAFPPAASRAAGGLSLPVAPAQLTDAQRLERDARTGVLAAIARLQAEAGSSREAALHALLVNARAGRLDDTLDRMLQLARDPRGRRGDGYPSTRTLKRWLAATDLTPKARDTDMRVPAWAAEFLGVYRSPQKPAVAHAYAICCRLWGGAAPSIHQVRRFLDKLGAVERERGRRLPRELKALRPFVRRDFAELKPGDVYTADGHTFDAEIAHPDHGKAFRPEITGVLDVATRRLVGWSAGLAESTWAVLDAQRHAFASSGLCALWYVDRGSGYANAMQTDLVTGFAARCGYQITHSLPYNSQARGAMERNHQSVWVRAAKELPTYMGAPMDREARQKVFKLTRRELRETGRAGMLMSWDAFVAFAGMQAAAYNGRPHRALTRIVDPATGRRRHMSPDESWAAHVAAGWAPVMPTTDEALDLFRPYRRCQVIRAEVRLHNHIYFAAELEEHHGDTVQVGYDIHDPSQVWVRDLAGRLIAVAQLDGNRRGYFPQSVVEQAREKRAAGRERRLQAKLDEVREKLHPTRLIEQGPTDALPPIDIPTAIAVPANAEPKVITLPLAPLARPWFQTDAQKYRWLCAHPGEADTDDAGWLAWYRSTAEWEDLFGEGNVSEGAAAGSANYRPADTTTA